MAMCSLHWRNVLKVLHSNKMATDLPLPHMVLMRETPPVLGRKAYKGVTVQLSGLLVEGQSPLWELENCVPVLSSLHTQRRSNQTNYMHHGIGELTVKGMCHVLDYSLSVVLIIMLGSQF